MSEPTQVLHPGRATIRTVAAGILALIPILPVLVEEFGLSAVPWIAGTLATLGAATRVLAIPAVNGWLADYLPWLAAAPHHGDYDHA